VFHGVATPVNVVNRQTSNLKNETTEVRSETPHSRFTIHDSRNDLFNGLPETF
jgi:hypothetical protein